MSFTVPIIDFSGFYSSDPATKQSVVEQIRGQCLYNGFFQITGHPVSLDVQHEAMNASKRFFALPLEEKQKVGKEKNSWNRGYEMLRSQILEEGTQPELKEGFYIGDEIPERHPYFINKRLNSGPNVWPAGMEDVEVFKSATTEYYKSVVKLAGDLLKALALTLGLEEQYFEAYMDGAVATMRLLHYPAQPKDADEKLTRGIGAHTDFGALTILMQDEVDGLQVWNKDTETWFDVAPTKGAFVVNLGNLMSRWTNEKYKSNIHRVINKSGSERYSIPVFISGNPDYLIKCLPGCKADGEQEKFPPITVEKAVSGGYAESYGRAQKYKQQLEKESSMASDVKALNAVAVA